MKSVPRGTRTSGVEVTNVSTNGLWLILDQREIFLSFADFPCFEHATIRQIARVERPAAHHLYWPELDVDLAVDSLERPEAYPLVSRGEPGKRAKPTSRDGRSSQDKRRKRRTARS